jgi:hypothetical protein
MVASQVLMQRDSQGLYSGSFKVLLACMVDRSIAAAIRKQRWDGFQRRSITVEYVYFFPNNLFLLLQLEHAMQ